MIKKSAFTLIEVLIALAISSFIMVAMFRIYLNSVEYVNTSNEQMLFNRKIYLLFDQIEKDLSAAFIPTLYEEEKVKEPAKDGEKKDDKKDEKKEEKKEEKKPAEEPKKQKKSLNFFKATIYEDQAEKIKDKKWELFKSVNFITTNPLQVYGQRKVRLVRVMYELVKDKEKSTREKTSYLLYRKESEDLENETLKESEEFSKKETKNLIRKQLVVDNVKGFYVDYMTIKTLTEKEKLQQQTQGRELTHSFVLDLKDEGKKDQSGKEKEKKLPTFILLKIILWNDDLSKQQSFDDMIPIFAYFSEEKKEEKKDEKKDAKKDDGKAEPTKLTMGQLLGQPQKLVAQADQPKKDDKVEDKKEKESSKKDEPGFAFEAGDQQIMITPEMMQSIRNRLLTVLQNIGKDQ